MKKIKKYLKNGLLSLSTFVLLALLIEIILRIVQPTFFQRPDLKYHTELGWTAMPNYSLYNLINRDHLVHYQSNEQGFRDREHRRPPEIRKWKQRKRNGLKLRRVVVLGDSYSEAFQVEMHKTYWFQLQEKLNAKSEDHWEIYNLGISGFGTVQEWQTLKAYGMDIEPDLVILQIFPYNDILNNSITGSYILNPQDTYRPYLSPKDGFQSITFVNPYTSWWRQHSYLCRFAFLYMNKIFGAWGDEHFFTSKQEWKSYLKKRNSSIPRGRSTSKNFEWKLFNTFEAPEYQMPLIQEGWQATDTAITRIIHMVRERNSKIVMAVVPNFRQLSPFLTSTNYDVPSTFDPQYAEKRITQLVRPFGVPVTCLVDTFEQNLDRVLPYLESHFNEEAHDLLSDMLVEEVNKIFPDAFILPPKDGL